MAAASPIDSEDRVLRNETHDVRRLLWPPLICRLRRDKELRNCIENYPEIEGQGTALDVLEIQFRALHDICIVPDFTAISAHLGQACDARFRESVATVAFYNLAKSSVLHWAVRARSNNAHVTKEDVQKFGKSIYRVSSQP